MNSKSWTSPYKRGTSRRVFEILIEIKKKKLNKRLNKTGACC